MSSLLNSRFAPSRYQLISVCTIAALLIVWTIVPLILRISPLVMPSPLVLMQAMKEMMLHGYSGKPLYVHIGWSLFRSLTGFLCGVALAIPVGLFMGYSRTVNAMLQPVFGFFRPIPPIAFIPLVIIWFGIGELAKILLIFAASFNYTVLNSAAGNSQREREGFVRSAFHIKTHSSTSLSRFRNASGP